VNTVADTEDLAAPLFRHNEPELCRCVAALGADNANSAVWWSTTIAAKQAAAACFWPNLRAWTQTGTFPCPHVSYLQLLRQVVFQMYRIFLMAPMRLRLRLRKCLNRDSTARIFLTHFDRRAWQTDRYRDVYWQRLLSWCCDKGLKLAVIGHTADDEHFVRAQLIGADEPFEIIPIEYFLNPIDVLKAAVWCVFGHVSLPREIQFQGKEISDLVRRQLKYERRKGPVFAGLCKFLAVRKIIRRLQPKTMCWPWENLNWERLAALACRQSSSNVQTVGYQHNTVPLFELNHFPAGRECEFAPLPDTIVTSGPRPGEMLRAYGEFGNQQFAVGCALRFEYLQKMARKSSPLPDSPVIGLPLSIHTDINIRILRIVADALPDARLLLKFHPLRPEDQVRAKWQGAWPQAFEIFDDDDMERFMTEIDIMLYCSSSVCCEAATIGLPAIYLDAGDGPSGDLIFDNEQLKWSASTPTELRDCVRQISELDDVALEKHRRGASEYMQRYFHPVTDENLERFMALCN